MAFVSMHEVKWVFYYFENALGILVLIVICFFPFYKFILYKIGQ